MAAKERARDEIQQQVDAFLRRGGAIQRVEPERAQRPAYLGGVWRDEMTQSV